MDSNDDDLMHVDYMPDNDLERLPDGTLRYLPDGTDRLIVAVFDHSDSRRRNIGIH